MPAQPNAEPGKKVYGLLKKRKRSSPDQLPRLAFMAAEKLMLLRPWPRGSATMPNRFGPTLCGPPFSKVWQAAHFLETAWPFSAEAVLSRSAIGTSGAAFAGPPAGAASVTAISQPGFSGGYGAKIAWAAKFVASKTRQVPRIA